ncbi:MAG: hypothetical protein ABEJ92_12110 [Halobacteriales archaeon]
MRRRPFLAGLAGTASVLAGCATTPPDPDPTPEPTPPPDVTVVTETRPLPTPGDPPSRAAARRFVAKHERRYVYNELVDGFASTQPAVDITVEEPRVSVVHAADRGYYLLSTCTGTARYFDPDGSRSSGSRNAASVAHFVGPGVHRRIPFNAYRCRQPVVPATPDERDNPPAARFQVYDFETPPDDDHPEAGGRTLDVTVADPDDGTVLDRRYRTSLPLTVQPGVTDTPGRYRLAASLRNGGAVGSDWRLDGPSDPAWWALAIVITYAGELVVLTWYPNGAVGLPRRTLCRRVESPGTR